MCAQALTTGAIQIVGKGVNEEIDFGFTNKVVLTGTQQWGQTGADILGMLDDWVDTVYTNGFANVDRIICGRQALKLLKNDKGILEKMDNRRYQAGGSNTLSSQRRPLSRVSDGFRPGNLLLQGSLCGPLD